VIANCPSCGTHYKHEPPKEPVRAHCGRCATTLDLGRLRPYRIVPVLTPTRDEARRAAHHLPIGLDHPALATQIAQNVGQNAPTGSERPVPIVVASRPMEIIAEPPTPAMDHEMTSGERERAEVDPATLADATAQPTTREGGSGATLALWLASGAIAGTGLSWTTGGTTLVGLAAGAAIGAVAGWMWLRWTSRK
jgi:hypothetical protein